MPLSDIVRNDVVTCPPTASAQDAAGLLESHNVGSLVVVEDGRPVGMLTDRDLAIQVVARGEPRDMEIEGLMSTPVHTVSAEAELVEAIDLMGEHAIRRLPVVDDDGRLTGLIALDDVLTLMVAEISLLEGVLMTQTKVGAGGLQG